MILLFKRSLVFLLVIFLPSFVGGDDRWVSAISNDDVRALGELVFTQDNVNRGDKADRSALMIAAKYGNLGLFNRLLDRGANPLAVTKRGGSVLMFAVLGKNTDIVNKTIKLGANVDAVADNGWSALTVAAAKGYTGILSMIIPYSQNINVQDIYGWTPLMRAVDNEHPDAVALLLDNGQVSVNAVNETGETALHRAAETGNEKVLRLLLSASVNKDIRDQQGRSAIDVLRERGHTQLIKLL